MKFYKILLAILFSSSISFNSYANNGNLNNKVLFSQTQENKTTIISSSWLTGKKLELIIQEIEPTIFIVQDPTFIKTNSLIVQLSMKDILIVGTTYTPQNMEAVLNWIEAKFGKGLDIVAINSHWHIDSVGGNQALIEKGIPIYGSNLTTKLLMEKQNKHRKRMIKAIKHPQFSDKTHELFRQFKDAELFPPTRLFPLKEGLTLIVGGKQIKIIYPGAGSTKDNVVVLIPSLKLLFGGDFILTSSNFDAGEANLISWKKAIKKFKNMDLKWVIPSHPDKENEFSPKLINYTEKVIKNYNKVLPNQE